MMAFVTTGFLWISGAAAEDPDWLAAGAETASLLQSYLRLDTTNPPGGETGGAELLGAFLEANGVATEIWEGTPGRANLVARVPGSGAAPPLCLLSHIDVATAEPERWPEGKGPLSGALDADGYLWGRGALDMKGMGALQVMTLVLLARQEVDLVRDVVLLAVADEEVNNLGIKEVVARWDEVGCSHVINEGGIGIKGLFFEDQTAFAISVGEKGVLWTRMIAEGPPGHGSVPRPDEAPGRLLTATEKITADRAAAKMNIHPAMYELLATAGAHQGGFSGFVLKRPFLVRLLVGPKLASDPLTRAATIDTLHITGLGGANQPNVVPSETWANIDSRLLPGTTPEAMLAHLKAVVDDPQIRFEVLSEEPAQVSEWRGDPVYDALVRHVLDGRPHAVAGPVISVGFTDSIYLRALGVRAYGIVPFEVTQEDVATMHGDGERVHVDQVTQGLQVLYSAVVEIATQ
jgi:acetylornithine deacetylase/succinyl-diaminopimelate desuccinylase-like protein